MEKLIEASMHNMMGIVLGSNYHLNLLAIMKLLHSVRLSISKGMCFLTLGNQLWLPVRYDIVSSPLDWKVAYQYCTVVSRVVGGLWQRRSGIILDVHDDQTDVLRKHRVISVIHIGPCKVCCNRWSVSENCYGLNVGVPSNSYVKVLNANGRYLGRGIWEIIRFRCSHEDEAPIMGLVFLQGKEERQELCFSPPH